MTTRENIDVILAAASQPGTKTSDLAKQIEDIIASERAEAEEEGFNKGLQGAAELYKAVKERLTAEEER